MNEDHVPCPVPTIVEFMQSLQDNSQSPSTLRVYLAAILSCRVRVDISIGGVGGDISSQSAYLNFKI